MDDFSKHYGRVLGFFRSRGLLLEDAQDLTQETFVRAARKKDELRSPAAFAGWILEIAKNVQINAGRSLTTLKRGGTKISLEELTERGVDSGELTGVQARDAPNPLDGLITAERLAAAELCLQDLPPEIRQCLRLYAYQEFTYQEIADILQIPLNTVRSNIHDGRSALKRCVEQRPAGDP